MNHFKTYLIIIVVAVVLGILFAKLKPADNELSSVEPYDPVVTELDFTETPTGFPVDIPIEAGAAVVLNNVEEHPTGTKATKVFITSKTPATNFSFYQDWLTANGWTLVSEISEGQVRVLNVEKGDQALSVTISTHASTGQKIVEIAVLTKK